MWNSVRAEDLSGTSKDEQIMKLRNEIEEKTKALEQMQIVLEEKNEEIKRLKVLCGNGIDNLSVTQLLEVQEEQNEARQKVQAWIKDLNLPIFLSLLDPCDLIGPAIVATVVEFCKVFDQTSAYLGESISKFRGVQIEGRIVILLSF